MTPRYTGMKDRDGTKIYEGDLLDFDEEEWGGRFITERVPSLKEFVKGFPLCGCYSDVAQFRRVVKCYP